MIRFPPPKFITGLSPRGYLTGRTSPYRRYQNIFLERYGPELNGRVIEIGGELQYGNSRYFPNASEFICSNISRNYDMYLDVTDLPFDDNSQDAYVCASVLNHVYDIQGAVSEMRRTLRQGGSLIIVSPFGFPINDVVDHWRPTVQTYAVLLEGFDVKVFAHLGGRFSTIVNTLQRPKGRMSKRHIPAKLLGLVLTVVARKLDRIDDFPLGVGIKAVKR
jgi:SAM-dependent methyltransferase